MYNTPKQCIVEDCGRSLRKTYNKRARLCSQHMKSPDICISGARFRFCQKCCKVEPLENFSGGMRSCIEGLDRQRKLQKAMRARNQSHSSASLPQEDPSLNLPNTTEGGTASSFNAVNSSEVATFSTVPFARNQYASLVVDQISDRNLDILLSSLNDVTYGDGGAVAAVPAGRSAQGATVPVHLIPSQRPLETALPQETGVHRVQLREWAQLLGNSDGSAWPCDAGILPPVVSLPEDL